MSNYCNKYASCVINIFFTYRLRLYFLISFHASFTFHSNFFHLLLVCSDPSITLLLPTPQIRKNERGNCFYGNRHHGHRCYFNRGLGNRSPGNRCYRERDHSHCGHGNRHYGNLDYGNCGFDSPQGGNFENQVDRG